MGWIKCSKEAFERCTYKGKCGSLDNAFFMDGSVCDEFNQSIKQTTVDAVPVARCMECRYYNAASPRRCELPSGLTAPSGMDFCSYGEKREPPK